MSKTVIEVRKNTNENNANLLRRFSRKVMDAGIIHAVKRRRYNERPTSKLSLKVVAVRRIVRRKEVEKLKKLGKIKEKEGRGGGR
jgi:ribosomal protein S21